MKGAPSLGEGSYELCYNKACSLLGLAKFADALQKLVQAEGKYFLPTLSKSLLLIALPFLSATTNFDLVKLILIVS